MNKVAKILSIIISLSVIIGVVTAFAFSTFAVAAPTFELKEVSRSSGEIVVDIVITEGKVNNLDISFDMVGITCTKITSTNPNGAMVLSNPTATDGSNISMVAISGVNGVATIATVTLKIDNTEKNSFSISVDACGVTDDSNNTEDVAKSVKIINNGISNEQSSEALIENENTPIISLNTIKAESIDALYNKVTISVNLNSGYFNAFDFSFEKSSNVLDCLSVKSGSRLESGVMLISNPQAPSGKPQVSMVSVSSQKQTGQIIVAEFKVLKNSDYSISIRTHTCAITDSDNNQNIIVTPVVSSCINYYKPTEPSTEPTTEPSTEPEMKNGFCGDNLNWSFNQANKTLTISGTGAMYNYDYTYSYRSYITSAPWREYYKTTDKIIIGDGVTSIGNNAFRGFLETSCIEIPASAQIGYGAFYSMKNVDDIIITRGTGEAIDYEWSYYETPWYIYSNANISIDNDVESIGDYMFRNSKIKSISFLPNELKHIGVCAFANCNNLEMVEIPDSVESIGDMAFYNSKKIKTVYLGNNPDLVIEYDVFNYCDGLESIGVGTNSLNYSTDELGVLYNKDKTGLIKYPAANSATEYTVDSNTAYINEHAFENSSNLECVILPESMISIGAYAFRNCSALKDINIPTELYSLCYYAFSECTAIQKIVLPENLKILEGGAFYSCANLNEVIYNCINLYDDDYYYDRIFSNAGFESGGFIITFTDSVKELPKYRLGGYITNVTIGKNVVNGGWYTFENISTLRTVNYYATDCLNISFSNCENLTTVTIGENVKTIPENFLYGCKKIDEVLMPQSINRIGCNAFTGTGFYKNRNNWDNDELRINNCLIEVKDNVRGEYVFNCDVTVVADGALKDCKITKATIPERIVSLGETSFGNTQYLKTVSFNAINCQYGDSAFAGSAVENFNIGNQVKILPKGILSGCDNVKEVYIPESVEAIGNEIFGSYQTVIRFLGTNRIEIMDRSQYYITEYKAVIYCKQDSFIHFYLDMNSAPFYLYNDYNDDVFAVSNNVLKEYIGSSDTVFVNFATKVGYGAFENNKIIKAVELSSSVISIYDKAFKDCNNLQTIIIPKNVSSIGDDAFDGCDNLEIWCYAGSYAEAYAKSKNIPIKYIKLQIDKDELELNANESVVLNASFNTQLNDDCKLIWSSDNPSAVKVNDNGKVTAIAKGKAVITATTSTGLHASCVVSVNGAESLPKVNSVTLGDITLNYKKSATLNPQITADDGASYIVTYTSSNPKVASVDENGNVKANKKGTAVITVTVTDTNGNTVTDTCNVKVNYNFGQWLIIIILFGWIWY